MKILLTGASGLLGTDIVHSAKGRDMGLQKLCLRPRPGFVAVDLNSDEDCAKLEDLDWDCVVHTAANRNPDDCEKNPESCRSLNVDASRRLALLAAKRKADFLFISTDYVFPGTKPPYAEDSPTSPVNLYGESKLAAERLILESLPAACILRVPFLYGIRAGLEACPMLLSTIKALDSGAPWPMEDSLVRYPTYTGDVAEAVIFLLQKRASGIFHFSGEDKETRYTITQAVAECLGKDMRNIVRLESPPASATRRPPDAHLSMEKLLSMGFPHPPSFRAHLKKIFLSR